MVPNVTKGGASFKGATAYYLHDKEAETADRVAWTGTVNLITRDPEKSARVMAATAMAQNELKAEVGIKASGRKLEKPVLSTTSPDIPRNSRTRRPWSRRRGNAFDAGRSAESISDRIGRTLRASVSKSARVDSLRQQQERQRQAVYQELMVEGEHQQAEHRATIDRRPDDNYRRYQAARTATLGRYEAEKCDYAVKWAERNQARREAWRQFRKTYEPLEQLRQQEEAREANRQKLYERQRENLRRVNQQVRQAKPMQRSRGRDRDDGLER